MDCHLLFLEPARAMLCRSQFPPVMRVGSGEELVCQGAGCPVQFEDQVDQVSTSQMNSALEALMPFSGEWSFSFMHLDQ